MPFHDNVSHSSRVETRFVYTSMRSSVIGIFVKWPLSEAKRLPRTETSTQTGGLTRFRLRG